VAGLRETRVLDPDPARLDHRAADA